jgi:hypothetical protein
MDVLLWFKLDTIHLNPEDSFINHKLYILSKKWPSLPSALGDFIKYVHNADPTPQLPSFAGPAATGCKAGRASGMIIYQLFKLVVLALFN